MKKWIIAIATVLYLAPAVVIAHPGNTDDYGCHHDRKRGGYHCH